MGTTSSQPAVRSNGAATSTDPGPGVCDEKLNNEIKEEDIPTLAEHFDNVDLLVNRLNLSPTQRSDVQHTLGESRSTEVAVAQALRKWRQADPSKATFRELVNIAVGMKREDVARDICRYIQKEDEEPNTKISVAGTSQKESPPLSHPGRNLYQVAEEKGNLQFTAVGKTNSKIQLERQTEKIKGKFSALEVSIINFLERNRTSIKRFTTFISGQESLKAVLTTAIEPSGLLFTKKRIVYIETHCKNFDDMIRMLRGYYSWFNFDLIEIIIENFCIDRDLNEQLLHYKEDMEIYCENRLAVCGFNDSLPELREERDNHADFKPCVFKVDKEWETMRFDEADRVKVIICDVLKLRRVTLLLRTASNGCVQLTFDIPEHVGSKIFPLSGEQVKSLHENGIRYCAPLRGCNEWEKQYSDLLKTEEDMESKVQLGGLMTVEEVIDEGEDLSAKWEELTMNVLNDVKEAKRIKTLSKLTEEYERIYDHCLQKQEQIKAKLNERKFGNEQLRLLHKYQDEWDNKYEELLDKEKKLNAKFLEEATLMDDWKKSLELFEERKMQTLDFNRLKEEQQKQYDALRNLSEVTEVTESEIQNMLCKSQEIALYAEQSQKAEDFLQKAIDFRESVEQSATDYKECIEILREKSELMNSTVQALSHSVNNNMLEDQIKKSQSISVECATKLEKTETSLEQIVKHEEKSQEEIQNARREVKNLQISFKTQLREFKSVKDIFLFMH